MPHWRIEQDLRATTLPWTFLRPSFFMQNLSGPFRAAIRDHDVITHPPEERFGEWTEMLAERRCVTRRSIAWNSGGSR